MAISLKYAAVVAILIIGVSSYPAASGSRGPEHPLRREVYSEGRLFDITHVFRPDLPEWGRKTGVGPVVGLQYSMKNGTQTNNSWLKLAVHTGTHCDAPGHVFEDYFEQGFDVDSLDLTTLNGPAIVIDVPRNSNITADVLKQLNIPRGVKRVLFKTLNTDRRLMWKKEFDTSYVGFMTDGAQWLVDNTDIKLVGLDYISVAAFINVVPAHVALLRNKDVVIIEGLKLDDIKPGTYNVHCLPLRLRGSEGSPTRCILIQ